MFFRCFHTSGYPENHYFSNHLRVYQYKSLMTFMIKRYQKDMKNMKSSGYRQKEKIKRTIYRCIGRYFKARCKRQISNTFSLYYRLYITYTLAGFLFDLDQSNICRDIQKIEPLIRKCVPIPQKIYKITKRLKTPEEVELYFPGFLSFIDSTEQPIPRPAVDKDKRKMSIIQARKKDIPSRIILWLTIVVISFIRPPIKKDVNTTISLKI